MEMVTSPHYWTPLSYCQEEDHQACPHQYASGVRFGFRSVLLAYLCPYECHQDCSLWPSLEVPNDEWIERCTCPGAARSKEIWRTSKEDADHHKEAAKVAFDEVLMAKPIGREETEFALETAYRRHGIELGSIERDYLPEMAQARLASRPQKDVLAIKALGRFGLSMVRAFREASSDDGPSNESQPPE
jgi:hypothetical protein